MREFTQEEIDMEAQLGAARNLQYALEDEQQLIEQVRPHPHLFIFSCGEVLGETYQTPAQNHETSSKILPMKTGQGGAQQREGDTATKAREPQCEPQ
jgi:hypothetical protein